MLDSSVIFQWAASFTALLLSLSYLLAPYSLFFSNVAYKAHVFAEGVVVMLLSSDKSWEPYPDVDAIKGRVKATKRIVFIRHGESEWNLVFNKGFGPSFFIRLVSAIVKEFLLLGTRDSIFVDSSLSFEGVEQAMQLKQYLETTRLEKAGNGETGNVLSMLNGDNKHDSVLVSSNLRRALETGTIALQARLQRHQEKVHILSSLQEVSRNVDANALAEPHGVPDIAKIKPHMFAEWDMHKYYDVSANYGQKSIQSNGLIRMLSFCQWAFDREEETIIVASGHSLWLRFFFKTFFPISAIDKYDAKKRKVTNCGVVVFELGKGTHQGKTLYRINPDSIKLIRGSFSSK